MQDLSITVVQADQIWENKSANFENYLRLLDDSTSDLIVLPEMFQTGFSMNTALAEDFQSSESIEWLKALSKSKDAAVYTSAMIRTDEGTYNRGLFVQPDGTVQHYDKRKTFGLAKEDQFFLSGANETIVEYKGWKIHLQICYDLRFPEIVRNKILPNQSAAYDVILYVANWPEKRSAHWNALLKARAIENQCYVVGVNRVGKDVKELTYSGNSQLVNALGEVKELPAHEEKTRTFIINLRELVKVRELLPFLRDR